MNWRTAGAQAAGIAVALIAAWAAGPPPVVEGATLTVNSTANAGDAIPGDGVCETAPLNGVCTLRAALQESNARVGLDTITFSIASGWQTIFVNDNQVLPPIIDPVVIDGTTQPSFAGSPLIEIRQGTGPQVNYALTITGGNTTVRGLSISGKFFDGIVLSGPGGNVIQGNYIGVRPDGSSQANDDETFNASVRVLGPNNIIGGTSPATRNVLVAFFFGVLIEGSPATANQVLGNYVSLDPAGTTLEHFGSIVLQDGAHGNTIGGTMAGSGNAIPTGVTLDGASGNIVQGNYIGTDATGMVRLDAGSVNMIDGASENVIGGSAPGARNVIGTVLMSRAGTVGNIVQGNYIGVGPDGSTPLGPDPSTCCTDSGVTILGPAGANIVGGPGPGEGNVIAHATRDGVMVQQDFSGSSDFNTIRGNSIYSNAEQGIDLVGVANGSIQRPEILSPAVSGTACAGCTVDVFSDYADEGHSYHGSTVADSNGNWTFSGGVIGPYLTATATDPLGNTSEFSLPFPYIDPTDTDGDGCPDQLEAGPDPTLGGDRDPNNFWDFFDVTGDSFIDLSDTLDVLAYFGDDGTSPAANLRDRHMPDSDKRWRTAESNDGVELTDALANLQSFGHGC